MKHTTLLAYALALSVGTLAAFFVIFLVIFSDAGSTAERLMTFPYVLAVYAAIGLVFGLAAPDVAWKWGWWLNLPAIALVAWYTTREPQQLLLHLAYLLVSVGASALGAQLGFALRRRRAQPL